MPNVFYKAKPGEKGGEPSRDMLLPPLTRDLPACARCGMALMAVALFHRDETRLPIRHAALAICQCPKCGWQYDGKVGTVVLYQEDPKAARSLDPLAWRAATEVEGEDLEDPAGEGTKLGGFPWWIQDGSTPICDQCRKPLRFILQIGPRELASPDSCGYVFLCPEEHQAKLLMLSSA